MIRHTLNLPIITYWYNLFRCHLSESRAVRGLMKGMRPPWSRCPSTWTWSAASTWQQWGLRQLTRPGKSPNSIRFANKFLSYFLIIPDEGDCDWRYFFLEGGCLQPRGIVLRTLRRNRTGTYIRNMRLNIIFLYRDALIGGPVLPSNSQAGPGRNVWQPKDHLLVNPCRLLKVFNGYYETKPNLKVLFLMLTIPPHPAAILSVNW